MKNILKFSGFIGAGLTLVAFILIMATKAVYTDAGAIIGTTAIFGNGNASPVWAGLLAWIFALVGLLGLLVVNVLPLIGVKALDRFALIINLCLGVLLVLAGVFCFIIVPATVSGTLLEYATPGIGAGWVIGGILFLAAGTLALCPSVFALIKK